MYNRKLVAKATALRRESFTFLRKRFFKNKNRKKILDKKLEKKLCITYKNEIK